MPGTVAVPQWRLAGRGGHFPMVEVPDAYVSELWAWFGTQGA